MEEMLHPIVTAPHLSSLRGTVGYLGRNHLREAAMRFTVIASLGSRMPRSGVCSAAVVAGLKIVGIHFREGGVMKKTVVLARGRSKEKATR